MGELLMSFAYPICWIVESSRRVNNKVKGPTLIEWFIRHKTYYGFVDMVAN